MVASRRVAELTASNTFTEWYNVNSEGATRTPRNHYEAREWCAVIDKVREAYDALLDYRRDDTVTRARTAMAVAMEIACRRLHGVTEADRSHSWDTANALSLLRTSHLGNDELVRIVNRDVTNARAVNKSSSSGHKGGKGKGKGRTNGGGEGKSASTDKASSK